MSDLIGINVGAFLVRISFPESARLIWSTSEDKYSRATDCLAADRASLLTYHHFPAANWCHICTANPIESTFATICLRHKKTRSCGSVKASLRMLFKLARSTEKGWRKLRGHDHFPTLLQCQKFIDGLSEAEHQALTRISHPGVEKGCLVWDKLFFHNRLHLNKQAAF